LIRRDLLAEFPSPAAGTSATVHSLLATPALPITRHGTYAESAREWQVERAAKHLESQAPRR